MHMCVIDPYQKVDGTLTSPNFLPFKPKESGHWFDLNCGYMLTYGRDTYLFDGQHLCLVRR